MKTLLALMLSIALFTLIGCSQQKNEELSGTWINMEYKEGWDPDNSLKGKVIFYPDGRFESYKIKSDAKADFKAVCKIEEKWADKDYRE
jgi:hypothetical protein